MKYLRKMGIQRKNLSAIFRIQESLWFSWEEILYNIVIGFGIHIQLPRLIKIGLTCFLLKLPGKEMHYRHCFQALPYCVPIEGFR